MMRYFLSGDGYSIPQDPAAVERRMALEVSHLQILLQGRLSATCPSRAAAQRNTSWITKLISPFWGNALEYAIGRSSVGDPPCGRARSVL